MAKNTHCQILWRRCLCPKYCTELFLEYDHKLPHIPYNRITRLNRICQLIILEWKYRMIKNKIDNNTVDLSYHLIAKSYWQGKSVMPLISFEKHKCNYSEKKQIQWRAGVYDWAATRVCNGVIFSFFAFPTIKTVF